MQVLLEEQSESYYNFIHSLHSESTKKAYKFCLVKFLNHYGIDLLSFLKLPQQDMTNLIIKYLVDRKVSSQYKNLITATLKHVCEINDIDLNWRKIKKFINSVKTGNETNGRDDVEEWENSMDYRLGEAYQDDDKSNRETQCDILKGIWNNTAGGSCKYTQGNNTCVIPTNGKPKCLPVG